MILCIGKYWINHDVSDKWLNFHLNYDFLRLRSLFIWREFNDSFYWTKFLFYEISILIKPTLQVYLSVLQALNAISTSTNILLRQIQQFKWLLMTILMKNVMWCTVICAIPYRNYKVVELLHATSSLNLGQWIVK